MRRPFLIVLFFAFGNSAFAQGKTQPQGILQPYYRQLGVQDGLPSNEVYDIIQDQKGYIWMCSDNGVVRYDGSEFVNYNESTGLCSNVVFGCKEDKRGRLWFYSYTGELCVYNPDNETFECPSINKELSGILNKNVIQNLVFNGDTVYVCGKTEYVKILYSDFEKKILETKSAPAGKIWVQLLSNGEAVVTDMLISRSGFFDVQVTGTRQIEFKNLEIKGKLDYTLSYKKQDHLLVLFGENALTIDCKSWTARVEKLPFLHTPNLKVHNNTFMCGSFNEGLWEMRIGGRGIEYNTYLLQKNVSATLVDRQGAIWGSSQTDGVYYIPSPNVKTFNHTSEKVSENVMSMLAADSVIYYTTYGGAVYRFNVDGKGPQTHLKDMNVRSPIIVGRDNGKVFLRRDNDLFWLDERKPFILHHETRPEFFVLHALGSNPVIFVNGDTLTVQNYSNAGANTIVKIPWKYGRVFAKLKLDSVLWLGTLYDAFVINLNSKKVNAIGKNHGLSRLYTRQLIRLGADTVAIVSSRGIMICAGTEVIKSIGVKDGLSSDKVLTVCNDHNKLWVGTASGLDLVQNVYHEKPKVSSVSRYYGLNPQQMKRFVKIPGGMVTGGNEGVFIIHLDDTLLNKYNPDLTIRSFSVNGLEVNAKDLSDVELGSGDKLIKIAFTDFDFRNSLNRNYRYRLISSNVPEWSYTKQNYIYLLSLPPGSYTLEVQRQQADGNWDARTCTQRFVIRTPFYKTISFVLSILILVSGIVYFVVRRRIIQIKKVNRLNQKLVEMKLQALGMQLNPHFVFNALNSVSYHMTRNDVKGTLKFLGKFATLMRLIFKNSKHTLIPLSEELKALKLYVETEMVRLGKPIIYDVIIDEAVESNACLIPALLLQPFVENAIWHGLSRFDEEGVLSLSISEQKHSLLIYIRDNGLGRKEAAKIKSKRKAGRNSLEVIEERLELLKVLYKTNVILKIDDAYPGQMFCGTVVELLIPKISKLDTTIEYDQDLVN